MRQENIAVNSGASIANIRFPMTGEVKLAALVTGMTNHKSGRLEEIFLWVENPRCEWYKACDEEINSIRGSRGVVGGKFAHQPPDEPKPAPHPALS